MADAPASLALVPEEGLGEAPLDAAAIRSRVEELALKCRRGREEEEEYPAAEAEADAARVLSSMYEVADEAMDEWDFVSAGIQSGDLGDRDAYLEWLRKKVTVAEEMNRKVSDEVAVLAETTTKDMIQLDVDTKALGSSLWKLDSRDLSHCEANSIVELPDSTDSCRNQSTVDMEYKYEVLKLDLQIQKSEMDLKLLQNMERDDSIWQLESLLSPCGAKVLDFKDNCLRIFPNDVCVDILIEMLRSSREVISSPSLGWLIQQIQRSVIVNALRRSLVNDANNSRHSFEYSDKEETIIAHLARGIDVLIKTSADWPLSSYGLELFSIHNSGTHPTNMTSSLLGKTKELANGLELHIRRHLVEFVDSIEEILVRELRSGLSSL